MGVRTMPLPIIIAVFYFATLCLPGRTDTIRVEALKSQDDQIIKVYNEPFGKLQPITLRGPSIAVGTFYNEKKTVCVINVEIATKATKIIIVEARSGRDGPVILYDASSSFANGLAYYVHNHSIEEYNLYVDRIVGKTIYIEGSTDNQKSTVKAIFTIGDDGELDYKDGSCVQSG